MSVVTCETPLADFDIPADSSVRGAPGISAPLEPNLAATAYDVSDWQGILLIVTPSNLVTNPINFALAITVTWLTQPSTGSRYVPGALDQSINSQVLTLQGPICVYLRCLAPYFYLDAANGFTGALAHLTIVPTNMPARFDAYVPNQAGTVLAQVNQSLTTGTGVTKRFVAGGPVQVGLRAGASTLVTLSQLGGGLNVNGASEVASFFVGNTVPTFETLVLPPGLYACQVTNISTGTQTVIFSAIGA